MSLQSELDAAKAEVERIESEMAALPSVLIGKTEQELADIYHAVIDFFRGNVPEKTVPVADGTSAGTEAPV